MHQLFRLALDFAVGVQLVGQVEQFQAWALRAAQVDAAIEHVEEQLLTAGVREVPSSRIGELVMHELRKLDKVAYIRFAASTAASRTLTTSSCWWTKCAPETHATP